MIKNSLKLVGIFKCVERNTATGEIIDQTESQNIVTDIGIDQLLKSFTDASHINKTVQTISIGNDIGNGTLLAPEQPDATVATSDHQTVFEIPSAEFFAEYPTPKSVRFYGTINGATVMAAYPAEANVVYTSAMLKLGSLEPFAYKRFPARTISELISVDISWTITLQE